MPTRAVNAIEVCYEIYEPGGDGRPVDEPVTDAETIVFVSGLGSQMVTWELDFLAPFLDAGHRVLRFDNRDVGHTTKFATDLRAEDLFGMFSGEPVEPPYLLRDMAADMAALLDDLDIDRAHVVGASMGGMIAQTFAIEHRDRLASLTSIMSTTGEPDVGAPQLEVLGVLLTPTPHDRAGAVEHAIATHRAIGSPSMFDEARVRAKAELAYDRCFNPSASLHQLLAVAASGDRAEGLAALDAPTLVIHGEIDPLVGVSGGRRTAELVEGAELVIHEAMGHDIPAPLWPEVTEAILRVVARA